MDKKEYENESIQNYLILKKEMEEKGIDYKTDVFNLYNTYKLLNDKFKDNTELMNEYEDKIYTVDGKKLNQMERIDLELNNIIKILNNTNIHLTDEELFYLYSLIKEIRIMKDENLSSIEFYKKELSKIQARLGMKNTFLKATYEVFKDLQRNAINELIKIEKGGTKGGNISK